MKRIVVFVVLGVLSFGLGGVAFFASSGEADTVQLELAQAQAELEALGDEFGAVGLQVRNPRIVADDERMYSFEVLVGEDKDAYVQGYMRSMRVVAEARARGELSEEYVDSVLVLPDGTTVPHGGEIPSLDLTTWSKAADAQIDPTRETLLPLVKRAAGAFELRAASVDVDIDGGSQVLSIDIVLSAEQTGEDLSNTMGQVWAEVRRFNSARPTIGLGYMRAFDDSGKQLVSEVRDFMLNGVMIQSDIDYPSE